MQGSAHYTSATLPSMFALDRYVRSLKPWPGLLTHLSWEWSPEHGAENGTGGFKKKIRRKFQAQKVGSSCVRNCSARKKKLSMVPACANFSLLKKTTSSGNPKQHL